MFDIRKRNRVFIIKFMVDQNKLILYVRIFFFIFRFTINNEEELTKDITFRLSLGTFLNIVVFIILASVAEMIKFMFCK